MNITKKDLPKSQVEISVSLSFAELEKYFEQAARNISQAVKIPGFREGKAPYEIVKKQVGEMAILEEAARNAINKILPEVAIKEVKRIAIENPEVQILKLAPGNDFDFKIILTLLPEAKLGEYKNLKVKKQEIKVEDKEIESSLERLAEIQVKEVIAEREAKEKDKALIKIDMFLDGIPVDGGQTPQTAIVLGHNYLVPGFDKQIFGMKKGEIKDFALPYPKEHHNKQLAGQKVEFKVELKEVYEREMPKIDDDFAKMFGLNNAEELKESMIKSLQTEKEKQADAKFQDEVMDKIVEKTNFEELPDILINREANALVDEMAHTMNNQGGNFDDYLQSIKKNRMELALDLAPQAIKRIKGALIIREIAFVEKIEVSDKELEERREQIIKQYKGYAQIEEALKTKDYTNRIHNMLLSEKVAKNLEDWNLDK